MVAATEMEGEEKGEVHKAVEVTGLEELGVAAPAEAETVVAMEMPQSQQEEAEMVGAVYGIEDRAAPNVHPGSA